MNNATTVAFFQNKIFTLEQALWENATGMHHTGFLILRAVASLSTCEVLNSKSVRLIYLIKLASYNSKVLTN
jgi:hypothetical protein